MKSTRNIIRATVFFALLAEVGAFAGQAPGFSLVTRMGGPLSEEVKVLSSDADGVKVVDVAGGRDYVYSYSGMGSPVREVRVMERSGADGTRWKMGCTLSEGCWLERASFPEIDLPLPLGADGEDDMLMAGRAKGGVFCNPSRWAKGRRQELSPVQTAAQFAALWDGDSGTYFGVEDAKGYQRQFVFERTGDGLRFSVVQLTWTANAYTQDYWVVTKELRRSGAPLRWYDFAETYRRWAKRQAWCAAPYLSRPDVPSWMKDAPTFTRLSRQWLERPDDVRRFVKWWRETFGEGPVIASIWGWEKIGTWWGPDYFPCHPSDETFKEVVDILKDADFHPFAWPSGYNWCKTIGRNDDGTFEWDGRERFVKPNESHIVVTREGRPHGLDAFWLKNGSLTTLCAGDKWSREWLTGIAESLVCRGCDVVQVDQVVCGYIPTCWSCGHGHPMGEGLWQWQSFRRQLEEMIPAMKRIDPDAIVGAEEPNEKFNDLVGIQDYRDLETGADSLASLYSYLYHGYVPMFQSNAFRGETVQLAHMATDGQMPFLRPEAEDMEVVRPALRNGGFEYLVDNSRGPMSWDLLNVDFGFLVKVDASVPLWNFSGCWTGGWLGRLEKMDCETRHGGQRSLFVDVPIGGVGGNAPSPVQISQTVDGLAPGTYEVSAWVKTACDDVRGSLRFGTRMGELGSVPFPEKGDWQKISATVDVKNHLRIIFWAPPGSRFWIDDVRLERDGREVVESGCSPFMDFMKRWIAIYRGEGRSFLAYGFQVPPPELKCGTFDFVGRTFPAVFHAAWENEAGERAVVLANATDRPQRVSFEWNGKTVELSLSPHDLRLVR